VNSLANFKVVKYRELVEALSPGTPQLLMQMSGLRHDNNLLRSRVQHLEMTIAQQTREIRQAKQAQDASLATIIKELRAANRKDTSGKPITKGATNGPSGSKDSSGVDVEMGDGPVAPKENGKVGSSSVQGSSKIVRNATDVSSARRSSTRPPPPPTDGNPEKQRQNQERVSAVPPDFSRALGVGNPEKSVSFMAFRPPRSASPPSDGDADGRPSENVSKDDVRADTPPPAQEDEVEILQGASGSRCKSSPLSDPPEEHPGGDKSSGKQGSSKSTSVDGSEDADPAANDGTKKKGSRKAKGDIQPTRSSSRHKS